MTPTPEQIAQWAREVQAENPDGDCVALTQSELQRIVAKACAYQAEQDAKLCDARVMGDNNREDQEAKRCAAAIRANAPKEPT